MPMSSSIDLERWIRAQYHISGTDQKGHFIGKKLFKERLIDRYPTVSSRKIPKLEIRQLVNRYRTFHPLDSQHESSPKFRGAYNPEQSTTEPDQRPSCTPQSMVKEHFDLTPNCYFRKVDSKIRPTAISYRQLSMNSMALLRMTQAQT